MTLHVKAKCRFCEEYGVKAAVMSDGSVVDLCEEHFSMLTD